MPSGKGPGLKKAKSPTTDTKKNKKKQRKVEKVSPNSKG